MAQMSTAIVFTPTLLTIFLHSQVIEYLNIFLEIKASFFFVDAYHAVA